MGGGLCQKVHRLRVLRHQRNHPEGAVPLLHQSPGACRHVQRNHRFPYRRRHRHRPPQEERDIAQYPAYARPAGLHPAIGCICQVRQRHRPRTSPVKPPGRKSQDAHCHQLCPQDVPRHAPYRRGQIRRPHRKQSHPLRRPDKPILPEVRRAQRHPVRLFGLGHLQARSVEHI